MGRINIERLNLRVRGVSPEIARQALEGLGPALQKQMRHGRSGRSGQIERVDAGKVSYTSPVSVTGLRGEVAKAISSAIQGKGRGVGQLEKGS